MSINVNIAGTDNMVGEYLIYRGFTQTFQSLEIERGRDRTKRFEVTRIVEAIFGSLNSFDVEGFISLWDFLNKRFFFHLDAEHVHLCAVLKSDLLKYYLVNATRTKNKDRISEFFSSYSHEILAESAEFVPGSFRAWYVLPYMDEPDKDPEFSVYFSQRWCDLLRITLHNFLSVVLATAPPPKLLLLERWFRSEAQQEIRSQLKQSSKKIDIILNRLERNEERLKVLREAVKELVTHVHKANIGGPSRAGGSALFETDEEADGKRQRAKELGQALVKLSVECSKKSSTMDSLPRDRRLREILGKKAAAIFFKPFDTDFPSEAAQMRDDGSGATAADVEELETALVTNLHEWLKVLTI